MTLNFKMTVLERPKNNVKISLTPMANTLFQFYTSETRTNAINSARFGELFSRNFQGYTLHYMMEMPLSYAKPQAICD